jgi:hypothetical protein
MGLNMVAYKIFHLSRDKTSVIQPDGFNDWIAGVEKMKTILNETSFFSNRRQSFVL